MKKFESFEIEDEKMTQIKGGINWGAFWNLFISDNGDYNPADHTINSGVER